jgi:type IV pilus assembly protein PilY1
MNRQTLSIAGGFPAVSWLLACGAMLAVPSIAHAACTPSATVTCIANQPIQSTNIVKPNVMFILDNSGSMGWDYMPDSSNATDARRRNFQYNTVYYNPNTDYTAAVPQRPNTSTGAIESMGSQTFTNAQTDPFISPASRVNLSTNFVSYSGDSARAAFYCKFVGGAAAGVAPCNTPAGYQKVVVSATSCVVSGDVTQ